MKTKHVLLAFNQSAAGRYKVQVFDPRTRRVVHERPWARNLILNQGLDGLATQSWQSSIAYCTGGEGNTPTQLDSGATTASQTTTSVTSSADIFTADDVGRLIRWDTGQQATISAYVSPTQVTVSNSATVASGEFTIYRVNQTGLFDEKSRSTGYVTGAGNCGTSISANTMTFKRTYEFDPEVSNINYAELGFSWTATPGQNCFSRVLIDGGAVSVQTGFQLRVIYELAITITPNTAQNRTAAITGWLNRVVSTTINSAGTGGTPGTYALGVSGGNGTGFAGTYTIGGGGTVTAITITDNGYDYTVAPTLAFPSGGISGASATANLDPWTQGQVMIQGWGLERVDESGNGTYSGGANEPYSAGRTQVSESSDAFEAFGTADDRTALDTVTNTLVAYTNGTYTRDKTGSFGVLDAVSTGIRAVMLAGPGGVNQDGEVCFTYLFNNAQTKKNTHRLSFTWRHTWNRSF